VHLRKDAGYSGVALCAMSRLIVVILVEIYFHCCRRQWQYQQTGGWWVVGASGRWVVLGGELASALAWQVA